MNRYITRRKTTSNKNILALYLRCKFLKVPDLYHLDLCETNESIPLLFIKYVRTFNTTAYYYVHECVMYAYTK